MKVKTPFKIGIVSVALLMIDQVLKWAAASHLRTPIKLTDWASLRYEQNTGIAWSIPIPYPWLIALNVLLLFFLPFLIGKSIDFRLKKSQFFLSLIVGGALGNLYDRLTQGYVIDYVSIGWWPVFNFADACLSLGIFLILIFYGKIKKVSSTKTNG